MEDILIETHLRSHSKSYLFVISNYPNSKILMCIPKNKIDVTITKIKPRLRTLLEEKCEFLTESIRNIDCDGMHNPSCFKFIFNVLSGLNVL